MKKTIAIVMVLVVCSISLAGDPNSMEEPTVQKPITKCIEEAKGILTLKMFLGDLVKEIGEDVTFNKHIEKFRQAITNLVFNKRVNALLELHKGESQAVIDAQLAAKVE